MLCNAFKLRKDHLKNHYVSHHGYDPKQALAADAAGAEKPVANASKSRKEEEQQPQVKY